MRDKIAFCICTKNRKLKLSKNLDSILKLKSFKKFNIEIILISNDYLSYNKILSQFKNKLKIKFFQENKIGLSHSRNKVLEVLRSSTFKYAAFFDDDCIISENWLLSMIKILKSQKADIVTGPQISKSKNIYLKIMERNQAHNTKTNWASTNNVFLDISAIKNKIRFSEKLNKIGGEDQLFFLKLNKLGKKIFWNSEAPVYELIDKKRENLIWFVKRNIRYGASAVIIYKSLYGNIYGHFFLIFKLLFDLFKSLSSIIKIFISPKKNFYKFIMYMMRNFGLIIGLFGFQIREY